LVFEPYVTGETGWLRPPGPVTVALHGLSADPVYITLAGHVTLVVVGDPVIENVAVPLLGW
jgi:hypothetical protein